MNYVRLFADDAGESHFEDVEISFSSKDFAPPAPPIGVSARTGCCGILFLHIPAGWPGDQHPAPTRQWMILLAGTMEMMASDGETRTMGPGSVVLMEDTSGQGHTSKVSDDGECHVAIVQIE